MRILFLADTHLGIDLPGRPRVERERRGEDFFANFERALAPVAAGETDLVVHGGDLFYRSRIPVWLAQRVFSRFAALADSGVDLFWVPGNHERSGVPRGLLLDHPRIHVFDRPRTFVVERAGLRIALAGLPFTATVRRDFPALLAATAHREPAADVRLLCLHQAIEGARVGPGEFRFRAGDDVLPGRALPADVAAVLCGHVHRAQVLRRDLAGRALPAPVLYPGAIERTSFAERGEVKGYLMLEVERSGGRAEDETGGGVARWEFRPLPARPMVEVELELRGGAERAREELAAAFAGLDPRCVVRLRLGAAPGPELFPLLRAGALRALAPPSMVIEVVGPPGRGQGGVAKKPFEGG